MFPLPPYISVFPPPSHISIFVYFGGERSVVWQQISRSGDLIHFWWSWWELLEGLIKRSSYFIKFDVCSIIPAISSASPYLYSLHGWLVKPCDHLYTREQPHRYRSPLRHHTQLRHHPQPQSNCFLHVWLMVILWTSLPHLLPLPDWASGLIAAVETLEYRGRTKTPPCYWHSFTTSTDCHDLKPCILKYDLRYTKSLPQKIKLLILLFCFKISTCLLTGLLLGSNSSKRPNNCNASSVCPSVIHKYPTNTHTNSSTTK